MFLNQPGSLNESEGAKNLRTIKWGILGPGKISRNFVSDLHEAKGAAIAYCELKYEGGGGNKSVNIMSYMPVSDDIHFE